MFTWRAAFVLSILAPAPSSSSPREVPQVDRAETLELYHHILGQGVRFTNVRPSTKAKARIIAYQTHII